DDVAQGWSGVQWPVSELESLHGNKIYKDSIILNSGSTFEIRCLKATQMDYGSRPFIPKAEHVPEYSPTLQIEYGAKPVHVEILASDNLSLVPKIGYGNSGSLVVVQAQERGRSGSTSMVSNMNTQVVPNAEELRSPSSSALITVELHGTVLIQSCGELGSITEKVLGPPGMHMFAMYDAESTGEMSTWNCYSSTVMSD
ncbi:hypothetical protein KI387_016415, partial [Taxus chinensis]